MLVYRMTRHQTKRKLFHNSENLHLKHLEHLQSYMMQSSSSTKTVRFDPVVNGVAVLSIYDYTPREVALCWYDDDQMFQITKGCWKVLQKMENRQGNKKPYCIRGLEGHSKVGRATKTRNRATAIAAVLMEQSKQWMDNKVDEGAIAEAYRRTPSSCQMWAQVMGKRDQEIAEAIHYSQEDASDCDHKVDGPWTANVTSIITFVKYVPQNAQKLPSSSSRAIPRILISV